MPGNVPRQLPTVAVPAAVSFGLRFESRKLAVVGQHPIRLELQQVFGIEFLRLLQRSASDTHIRERQRSRDIRHHRRNRIGQSV